MLRGAIVAESLRLGAKVEGVGLVVRKLERLDAGIGDQPGTWTLVSFEADDDEAELLAAGLSDGLEPTGGWHADFHSDAQLTVVFGGRTFRYRRGDTRAREEVPDYARSVGVPEEQRDWAE